MQDPHKALQQETRKLVACEPQKKEEKTQLALFFFFLFFKGMMASLFFSSLALSM